MRAYRHVHIVVFDEADPVDDLCSAHYLHRRGKRRERFLAEYAPGVLKSLADSTLALVTFGCDMIYCEECFALDEIEVLMTLSAVGGNRISISLVGGNRISMDFDFRRGGVRVARGSQTGHPHAQGPTGAAPVPPPAEPAGVLNAFA